MDQTIQFIGCLFVGLAGWLLGRHRYREVLEDLEHALALADAFRRENWILRKALGHHKPRTGRVLMEHYGHLYEYTWEIENDGEILRVIVTDFEEGVLSREGAESLCRAVHWIRERAMEDSQCQK